MHVLTVFMYDDPGPFAGCSSDAPAPATGESPMATIGRIRSFAPTATKLANSKDEYLSDIKARRQEEAAARKDREVGLIPAPSASCTARCHNPVARITWYSMAAVLQHLVSTLGLQCYSSRFDVLQPFCSCATSCHCCLCCALDDCAQGRRRRMLVEQQAARSAAEGRVEADCLLEVLVRRSAEEQKLAHHLWQLQQEKVRLSVQAIRVTALAPASLRQELCHSL